MDLTGRAAEMGRATEMVDLVDLAGRATAPVGLVVLMAQVAPILAMGLVTETAARIRRDPPNLQPFRNRR